MYSDGAAGGGHRSAGGHEAVSHHDDVVIGVGEACRSQCDAETAGCTFASQCDVVGCGDRGRAELDAVSIGLSDATIAGTADHEGPVSQGEDRSAVDQNAFAKKGRTAARRQGSVLASDHHQVAALGVNRAARDPNPAIDRGLRRCGGGGIQGYRQSAIG